MAKIIVTSRYLTSGARGNLKNYVKYIATRPNAVIVRKDNAQEREKYMHYLAHRPGAVKVSGHALFSQTDDPIDLNAAANEIANHGGNVWTHVVSLRRADAQQMGYETLDAWRSLVRRQMPIIAKQMKIDLNNLRWYAAFHDKEENPHVHIVVYSIAPKEGFLTEHGIEKIRSSFANDVYADELHHLYEQQTDVRDLLKRSSAEQMRELTKHIGESGYGNDELGALLMHLKGQLTNTKGKKMYGYLKQDTKRTVDAIFTLFAKHPDIQRMYALWCDMEQRRHDVYSSAKVTFPPITENSQFRSVKNMIVRAANEMQIALPLNPEELLAEDFIWHNNAETVCVNVTESIASQSEVIPDGEMAATMLGLFTSLSRMIEDDYLHQERQFHSRIDRKLRKMIQKQKEAIGLKSDVQHY